MPDVYLYDTTLRDGAAREGVSFSLEDKIKILKRLDAFGMHYVEGGYPASNPKDKEFFEAASKIELANSKLSAVPAGPERLLQTTKTSKNC